MDVENSKLLEIVKSRRQEDLREVLLSWGPEVLNGIEEVSMWKPYQSLVEELMPNAEVIADRVTKQVNEELDNCRKQIKNEAKKLKRKSEKEEISSVLNKRKAHKKSRKI